MQQAAEAAVQKPPTPPPGAPPDSSQKRERPAAPASLPRRGCPGAADSAAPGPAPLPQPSWAACPGMPAAVSHGLWQGCCGARCVARTAPGGGVAGCCGGQAARRPLPAGPLPLPCSPCTANCRGEAPWEAEGRAGSWCSQATISPQDIITSEALSADPPPHPESPHSPGRGRVPPSQASPAGATCRPDLGGDWKGRVGQGPTEPHPTNGNSQGQGVLRAAGGPCRSEPQPRPLLPALPRP